MAASASSNSTSNWVQKTATHSYLEGAGNQFTGRTGNNACSQIVVEAVKRILSNTPPIKSREDINAIVNTGTANHRALLEKTASTREALGLDDYLDIGSSLDEDLLCKVAYIRDTNLKQKTYTVQVGSIQTDLLTAHHPRPQDIKHCFDKAIGDLAAIAATAPGRRAGGEIIIQTVEENSKPISIAIALQFNQLTKRNEYFLFDSHGDKFALGKNNAILHKFTNEEEFLEFIGESLLPSMDEYGYRDGEDETQEMFRTSAATSVPSKLALTPIILSKTLSPPPSPSARGGGSPQIGTLGENDPKGCVIS